MYSDLIIDLYKHPLNKRVIENPTFTHSGANVTCGDHIRIYGHIRDANILTDISFEGEGCAIFMASASLITEYGRNKSINEVLQWNSKNLFEFLESEIGATRIKCALLPLEVFHEGLKRADTN